MNVAVLVGRIGVGTGTGGVAAALVASLRARGHRVEVWAGAAEGPIEGVPVHPLGDRRTAAERVPAGFVRFGLDRVPGCHVVRASGGVHAAWVAVRGRWAAGDRRERALDRDTARGARVVICHSSRTAGEVIAHHRVDPTRIRLVRTGVDGERFRPDPARRHAARLAWEIPEGGRVALFLGHGFRRKGLDVAAAAFARVGGPADRLVVAGEDAHAERHLEPVRAALGRRLVVVGRIRSDDALPGADALLHPTAYDPAANTTLEALSCGVPPITSARDGAAELIPDRALVVADPGDVQGFARALRYAWGDAPDRARLRVEASRWPVPRMTEAMERILEEAADGG